MNKKRLNLHILGPQGSGKGTQSKILAKRLKLIHLSAGQLFRDRIEARDHLAKKLKKILDAGQLVPLEIYQEILKQAINRNQNADGFVFDGVIRNNKQMQSLEKIWIKYNLDKPWLIVIDLPDNEAIQRIEKRLTCSKCQSIFIADRKFKQNTVCPKCKGMLEKRSDDSAEVVKKRLKTYYTQTLPIINYFRAKNRAIEIDGRPSIRNVTKQIFIKLQDYQIL